MAAVLVTGAGRRAGIAAACALALAGDGWDIGLTCWRPYDRAQPDPGSDDEPEHLLDALRATGVRAALHPADLGDPRGPATLVAAVSDELGPLSGLVAAHCHDVALPLAGAGAGELDAHFAVNARSVALLVTELMAQLPGGDARVVAFTSDALEGNVPYGVSKAALDRIILAAAREHGPLGLRANCINPGPNDTGWMSDETKAAVLARTPLGRLGTPADSAGLVRFLFSPGGAWVTGQLLHSDGGFH